MNRPVNLAEQQSSSLSRADIAGSESCQLADLITSASARDNFGSMPFRVEIDIGYHVG